MNILRVLDLRGRWKSWEFISVVTTDGGFASVGKKMLGGRL